MQQGQRATSVRQDTLCGTSPVSKPALPVGEVAGPGGVSCTLGGTRKAGEVAEGSFPTPRGTHSSGRGSAARLHHSPGFPEYKRGPRSPTLGLTKKGRPGWETQVSLQTGAPAHPLPGAAQDRPFAFLLHHGSAHTR